MQLAQHLAHLVLPRHTNNHRAKALHPSFLTILAVALLLFQFGLNFVSQADSRGSVLGYAANISPEEVIRLTNQKRAEAGLPALKVNQSLSEAAAAKGAHMLANDYWAHVAPDGTQPWKFFNDIGYKYKYAGENLARDFSSASTAVNAWMASPTHKENLLSPKYKEIGIGVVEGDLAGVDTTLIVQFFGTTLTDSLAPAPVAAASNKSLRPSVTPSPKPLVAAGVSSPVPESREVSTGAETQVLLSPFSTNKSISLGIIAFLIMLLTIDIISVARRKVTRISSRSLAHIAFLGMILAVVIIIQAGKIL